MVDMTLDDVFRAALRLPADERAELVRRLQGQSREGLTREKMLAEFERRKASGAFEKAHDFRDKYPQAVDDDLTDEQLLADIHEIATEWEKELDELGPADDNS